MNDLVKVVRPSDYGLPHTEWYPNQLESIQWAEGTEGTTLIEMPTGCHAPGQLILMADGRFKKVEDVWAGDLVMGTDSKPRTVLELHQGRDKMYRIVPVKGESFVVNEGHILTLVRTNTHKQMPKPRKDSKSGEIVDVSLREWMTWSTTQKSIHKILRIGVEFPEQEVPIEPYMLGIWLGDGHSKDCEITKPDPEILEYITDFAGRHGYDVKTSVDHRTLCPTHRVNGGFKNVLRSAGLLNNKHVPNLYKMNSSEVRLQLLAGLLDTDGHYDCGFYDIAQERISIANDILYLARSLGFAAYMKEKIVKGKSYWRVSISGDVDRIPLRIARKKAQPRQQKKSVLRTGFKVESLDQGDYYGFTLDGDGRYLLHDFTITHNSGKTGLAKAQMHTQKGIALVKTKFLQDDNYLKGYGFTVLKGKDNYPCIHTMAHPGATCSDCLFKAMVECELYPQCHYIVKRGEAQIAQQTCLNYAYWLAIRSQIDKEDSGWTSPQILLCDEAHQLRNITMEHAGVTISEEKRLDWELPMFPIIRESNIGGKSALGGGSNAEQLAGSWLSKAISILNLVLEELTPKARNDPRIRGRLRAAERLSGKLMSTRVALAQAPNDWFIRSGPGADEGKKAFVAWPLTAKYHFPKWFMSEDWKLVVMSATIGDEATFAASLGITDYSFKRVPSRFSPKEKPVFDLGVPRLGMKSPPSAWELQADKIVQALKECDPKWHGIIHTTSHAETARLAQRLAKRGLQDRVFTARQGESTAVVVQKWHEQMRKKPGSLIISPVLAEGYDGRQERINLNAKCPYPSVGSDYAKTKRDYDMSAYNQETATNLEQQMGRVRRSPDDYDTNGERHTFNAICDGGFKYIVKYMSPDFRESIVSI